MAAAAHNPAFAAAHNVPIKVAKEFNSADAGTGILGKRPSNRGKVPGFGGGKTRSWTGS